MPSDLPLPRRSGWFAAPGILLIVLGLPCWIDVVFASPASTTILGALLFAEPVMGSVLLTALLAVCLVPAGGARIAWSMNHRGPPGWWLPLPGGLLALLVGILICATLPWSGLWVPGTLPAIEPVVGGVGMVNVGAWLRRVGARAP